MSTAAGRAGGPVPGRDRAARILDVAGDLLLRHGYRRVSIEDVAAGASIGKGTIYLHWKSREQLFAAVFERAVVQAIAELSQRLREDPQVSLLHRFARVYFLAIMNRPLLRGFILTDTDLLGRLAEQLDTARDDRHRLVSHAYIELLVDHGMLRDDMDVDAVSYAFWATFEGFLRAEAAGGASATEPAAAAVEQRADLLARTIQRAFESGRTVPAHTLRSLAAALASMLADLADIDQVNGDAPGA